MVSDQRDCRDRFFRWECRTDCLPLVRPGILTVAAGSIDGEASKLVLAIVGVSDLDEIEQEIDRLLRTQGARAAAGDGIDRHLKALNVAAHRLQSQIHDRRIGRASQQGTGLSA